MKHFLPLLLVCCAGAVQPLRAESASVPYFEALRSEVTNQLSIVSNAPVLDKRLVATLKTSLKLIDKTKTNYTAGTKSLGTLAKLLLHTSISNAFAGVLADTAETYLDALLNEEELLADRVARTDFSSAHGAAQKNLDQLGGALHAASTNTNVMVVAKYLSLAAKKLVAATAFTAKAETAVPPPANVTATVSGEISFAYQGGRVTADHGGTDSFTVTSSQATAHPKAQHTITLRLEDVIEGRNQLIIGDGSPGTSSGEVLIVDVTAYRSITGTATVLRRSATKRIFGSFEFTAGDSGHTVTVTGTFSAPFSP